MTGDAASRRGRDPTEKTAVEGGSVVQVSRPSTAVRVFVDYEFEVPPADDGRG